MAITVNLLTKSSQSWVIPNKNAALPPISDHKTKITRGRRDIGSVVSKNSPNVRIEAVAQSWPSIG